MSKSCFSLLVIFFFFLEFYKSIAYVWPFRYWLRWIQMKTTYLSSGCCYFFWEWQHWKISFHMWNLAGENSYGEINSEMHGNLTWSFPFVPRIVLPPCEEQRSWFSWLFAISAQVSLWSLHLKLYRGTRFSLNLKGAVGETTWAFPQGSGLENCWRVNCREQAWIGLLGWP